MTDEFGDALPDLDPARIVDLDVRDDLAGGRPPLPRIRAAVAAMAPGQILHLRSTLRPGPLIGHLRQLGFRSRSVAFADADWSSWFWRDEAGSAPGQPPVPAPVAAPFDSEAVIDLRLLPPPEPLLRILERAESDRTAFEVLLPFYPDLLPPLLEPMGRRLTVVAHRGDGVQVRIEAPS